MASLWSFPLTKAVATVNNPMAPGLTPQGQLRPGFTSNVAPRQARNDDGDRREGKETLDRWFWWQSRPEFCWLSSHSGLSRINSSTFLRAIPRAFPHRKLYEGEVEDVWLQTADGVRINAFYRPNPASKQVLLWFHGNAENIGYGLDHLRMLAKIGVNILAVDYRGYGRSEGKPDEAGVYRDADAAYDYLIKQRHFRA